LVVAAEADVANAIAANAARPIFIVISCNANKRRSSATARLHSGA